MHPNEKLIEAFYTAFRNSDPVGMAACYHPDVEFSDPIFPNLKGNRARAMWAMLGQRKADPSDRTFRTIEADDQRGRAHWEARYTFSSTGRMVHNRVEAEFEFLDGKIRRHTDRFDFWVWSRMALGLPGLLLGWGPLKALTQKRLAAVLDQFIREHPEHR
ncbi:MAG: nuclear transport factor 2 family protein [Polyangiaceae bacterium]